MLEILYENRVAKHTHWLTLTRIYTERLSHETRDKTPSGNNKKEFNMHICWNSAQNNRVIASELARMHNGLKRIRVNTLEFMRKLQNLIHIFESEQLPEKKWNTENALSQ